MEYRTWLRQTRKQLKLTQREFASILGIVKNSYSNIERGACGISPKLMRQIGNYFKENDAMSLVPRINQTSLRDEIEPHAQSDSLITMNQIVDLTTRITGIEKQIETLEKSILQIVEVTNRLPALEEKFTDLEDQVAKIDPMFPEYLTTKQAAKYIAC